MTPREALDKALEYSVFVNTLPKRPGIAIERCGKEIRAALEGLTSKDAANTRYPNGL